MSRTYRNRLPDSFSWALREYMCGYDSHGNWYAYYEHYDKNSEEGKKRIAKTRSDAYKDFKEPGPSWYRNIFTERPQRREAKKALRKYLLNEDYEVLLFAKNPLDYWT